MSASQDLVAAAGSAATTQRRGYTPTDTLFLGWLLANTAVLLAHSRDVEWWPLLLLINIMAAALVPLLARAPLEGVARFVGGSYPLLLTAAYYPQLGIINTGVGRVHDATVQAWDLALFGSQVSVTWHQAMPNLVLSELLHFSYGSFYWIVVFAPVFLFFRKSNESFERGAFVMTLVLYACYLCFALFPVAGPRYFFGVAEGPEAQGLIARTVHAILEGGSAWGTAFPSSHVAAAWAAVFVLWRDARRTALVLIPVSLGVPFGTVYGQFHYGVDALAGVMAAVLLCALADPLRNALRRKPPRMVDARGLR